MPRRPQPVAIAQAVSSLIPILIGLLVALGVLDPGPAGTISDTTTQALAGVLTAVTAITALVATIRARAKVTPLSDPRDDQGLPLISTKPVR